jgi:hypothetical protein
MTAFTASIFVFAISFLKCDESSGGTQTETGFVSSKLVMIPTLIKAGNAAWARQFGIL